MKMSLKSGGHSDSQCRSYDDCAKCDKSLGSVRDRLGKAAPNVRTRTSRGSESDGVMQCCARSEEYGTVWTGSAVVEWLRLWRYWSIIRGRVGLMRGL